jgi:hypothetical protein
MEVESPVTCFSRASSFDFVSASSSLSRWWVWTGTKCNKTSSLVNLEARAIRVSESCFWVYSNASFLTQSLFLAETKTR